MTEIERMSYIFGSFARRRQSQEVSLAKRRSMQHQQQQPPPVPPIISHDRSSSAPMTTTTSATAPAAKKTTFAPAPPSPRTKSICRVAASQESRFKCSLCERPFQEPRVLPCLHTFCLRCLQELEASDHSSWKDDDSDGSPTNSESQKDTGSAGSGYASGGTPRRGNSPVPTTSNPLANGSDSRKKFISCPTCQTRVEVPAALVGGVSAYPPNYLLQHRMVLAALNSQNTHLLCDLCTSDVTAVARCMECAISFCRQCEEVHLRQKSSMSHEVLSLDEARKKGITKVRRQILCPQHPDFELSIFCSTCYQVICKDCNSNFHKGHTCEPVTRAIRAHLTSLRMTIDKTKSIAEQSALAANRLHTTSKKIEAQCSRVQTEVEKFIENYIKAVENHRRQLLDQIAKTRSEKLQEIGKHRASLHRRVREARDVAHFLEELLSEGTDVEVMSFLKPVLKRVAACNSVAAGGRQNEYMSCSDSLQFLPEEVAQYTENCCPLYGVVTTQTVFPANCVLNSEDLTNLRIGKKTEIVLETRDKTDTKVERGGEQISAEIRYRDAGVAKFQSVDVEDRRDGTYCISFTPDVSGKLVLNVTVKDQPIKDSPFAILVRSLRPHQGTFHCCSFCSSGGSKEAHCGCGGRMPGGYKGCGHGHEGHPGRRHWSCCGNILEHSECNKLTATTSTNGHSLSHYQFTL